MGVSSKPSEESQEAQNASTERVYMGGFRPPFLTASEVLKRLQESMGEILDICPTTSKTIHDDQDARFMHITVRCKDNSSPSSAMEHLSKMYHNVTWKGCRLRVEAARPHFLQRLQEEITERKRQSADGEQDERTTMPPKRYWKIRQRYGETAFKVDTKPYDVDCWISFDKIVHKTKKRRLQYEANQQPEHPHHHRSAKKGDINKEEGGPIHDIRTQHRFNRAVHLRFTDSSSLSHNCKLEQRDEIIVERVKDDASASSDSEQLSDSSSTWSSSAKAELEQKPPQQASSYAWSSESSSNEDESDLENESGKQGEPDDEENGNHDKFLLAKMTDEFVSGMDDQEEEQRQWDERSDHSDSVNHNDDDDHDVGDDANLIGDVEANLSVLSSLFPDLKTTKPRLTTAGGERKSNADDGRPTHSSSGWGAGGVMLRYDPTKDVAAKLPVHAGHQSANDSPKEDNKRSGGNVDGEGPDNDENEEKGTKRTRDQDDVTSSGESSESSEVVARVKDDAQQGGVHDSDDRCSSSGENRSEDDRKHQKGNRARGPQEATTDEKRKDEHAPYGNIYKQDKLEDVFRESRDAFMLSQTPQVTAELTELNNDGVFSFSFNLGPPIQSKPPVSRGSFSFAFFHDDHESKGDSGNNDNDDEQAQRSESAKDNDAKHAITDDHSASQIPSQPQRLRRRGMFFPAEVLDTYQEAFYVSNDGLKILQDLERYRNDPQVKEHWKQERQTLTQDWKRKKKQAQQSRKPKQKFSRQHH